MPLAVQICTRSPSSWIPTNLSYVGHVDGIRPDGFVNSYDLFINGGSGSVFSRAAILDLDTSECVEEMKPTGPSSDLDDLSKGILS